MLKKSSEKGFECEEHIDGSKTCRRFVSKKGNVLATGTDIDLVPDPNTCKVRVVGRIMDGDRESVDREIKELESRCKKGF